jgi:asparagine synthase (glutamine-hydrolysing)
MCGVAGVLNRDRNRPVSRELLLAMGAIQQHRGPDGYDASSIGDRGVGFSHVRLSIVDLDENRARQPFCSADGRFLLVCNGELYDYRRLRADLTARGHQFRTKSDTELILQLVERFGLDGMLEHLRGEFAFALYDRQLDRLALVRDRFGIKPLYWTVTGDELVFGSEIKALFAHPAVQRSITPTALLHQLMQTMVPGTTAFEGVHAVEPGHVLVVDRREGRIAVRSHRYWDVDYPREGEHESRNDAQNIEQLRELFVDAVRLRLDADVEVGCYLSGGVDSCSIMGVAAACQQAPVRAFTIGFDHSDYDESAAAREMARATGAAQDIVAVRSSDLYGQFARTIWHTERSIYNTFCIAKLMLSEYVRRAGYKVVVSGEGSDEIFAGYPQLRIDHIRHGMASAPSAERAELEDWLRESNALFRGNLLTAQPVRDGALESLIGFTPSCLQSWLSTAPRARALMAPDVRHAVATYEPGAAIAGALRSDAVQGRCALDKVQYVWLKTQFESQVLGWAGDRVDMANAIEARPAFLDHPLVEFAATLPPSSRLRGRRDKYMLRETMQPLLPDLLYRRQKFAFMAPPSHAVDDAAVAMRALADDVLGGRSVESAGLLDAGAVATTFARHAHGDTPVWERVQLDAMINHMMSVQLLHRQFVATDVPAQARARVRELGWT